MTWQTTNLAESMGGLAAQAAASIAEVTAGLNKLTNNVNVMKNGVSSSVSTIASTKTELAKLTESGFYMITLAPKRGSWSSRLSAAPNAPPNLDYCCGTAVITVAPDLTAAENAYTATISAVKKPMADASNIVDRFDFADFIPELPPEDLADIDEDQAAAKDWSDLFTSDVWSAASLGDVFGGYVEGLSKATNKLSKETRSALGSVNQAARAASAITRGLTAAKNLVAQMTSTGVYRIALLPGKGNYLQRLRNEPGAPPTGISFTSGYVCIAVAEDLNGLASKYETLSKIVGK